MSTLALHGFSTPERTTRMRSDSDCPSTWTPHTSTPCTARVYLTHGYRISPFMDSSACVITPSSLRSSAKGAARERHQVRCVNEGHARLRKHPPQELEDERFSRVETLRAAIYYIKHLWSVEPAVLERQSAAMMENTRSSWRNDINVPQSQLGGRLGEQTLNSY
uniref:BHLH domain-containing protein n=1 Tax=Sparus aurata TaxID=8175 RepID=A0A671VKK6_SPAAU